MSRVNRALCDPITPRTDSLSTFDVKNSNLEHIKRSANLELRRHNQLRLRYRDWFKHRSQSVLKTLRTVHILGRDLVPKEIECISDFYKVCYVGKQLAASGIRIDGLEILKDYSDFWYELKVLSKDFDHRVRHPVKSFVDSIGALRNPEVKDQFDNNWESLRKCCDEDFYFSGIHNERDNLYTYGMDIKDDRYLGLMQFIPYVADLFSKTCFLVKSLYIEKE